MAFTDIFLQKTEHFWRQKQRQHQVICVTANNTETTDQTTVAQAMKHKEYIVSYDIRFMIITLGVATGAVPSPTKNVVTNESFSLSPSIAVQSLVVLVRPLVGHYDAVIEYEPQLDAI
jgi:hypothetical protein